MEDPVVYDADAGRAAPASAEAARSGVRCMLMRGGTSKGVYLHRDELPLEPAERDRLVLSLLGSPDVRQIDGLGGAHPLTSKVAIVGPSGDDEADVEYLFLQVGVDEALVTDRQNCGNLLAGVGPFAVERGIVDPGTSGSGPDAGAGGSGSGSGGGGGGAGGVSLASVRIRMLNTGGVAVARFPVDEDGRPRYDGGTAISGVPGTAARIDLEFRDIAGGTCGALLPTGRVVDTVDGLETTCVDNGMPVVVVAGTALGVRGDETCEALEADTTLRERVEELRLAAGTAMGLGDVRELTVPKVTIVAPPHGDGDVSTRTFIPHRCHTSIGVLGAVSVATACLLPGSAAREVFRPGADPTVVTLEHPTGVFSATVTLTGGNGEGDTVRVERAGIIRTARKLMDGTAFPRP